MAPAARVPVVLVLGGLAWAGAHAGAHRLAVGAPAGGHGPQAASAPQETLPAYVATSLALCLALALVLAGTAALRGGRGVGGGRRVWLFGAVPVLGLGGEVLAVPTGHAAALAGLAPLLLVVLGVQAAVALVAVRVAHGLLDVAASLARAFAATVPAPVAPGRVLHSRPASGRAPASRLELGGAPRAPPTPARA